MFVVVPLALLMAAIAGGGAEAVAPTVLTMAVADTAGPSAPAAGFAKDVSQLSNGRLLITFRVPTRQSADGELVVVRDVEQGEVEMGQIPTRAWDAVGVPAFAPLQAPFLITNYALLQKVVTSSLGRAMQAGTLHAGVRTLGLAAFDLHVPLGATRPFVGLSDFGGAIVRIPSNSALTTAIMAALGATATSIASGPDLLAALQSGAVDGALTSPGFAYGNGYAAAAKFLTTNLVFFPRVDSVAINEHVFKTLTVRQRTILRKAAAEMTRQAIKGIRARDQFQVGLLCRLGVKVYTATRAQLAALRRAEQPVYDGLARDPSTAARIKGIEALKRRTKPTAPVRARASCRG